LEDKEMGVLPFIADLLGNIFDHLNGRDLVAYGQSCSIGAVQVTDYCHRILFQSDSDSAFRIALNEVPIMGGRRWQRHHHHPLSRAIYGFFLVYDPCRRGRNRFQIHHHSSSLSLSISETVVVVDSTTSTTTTTKGQLHRVVLEKRPVRKSNHDDELEVPHTTLLFLSSFRMNARPTWWKSFYHHCFYYMKNWINEWMFFTHPTYLLLDVLQQPEPLPRIWCQHKFHSSYYYEVTVYPAPHANPADNFMIGLIATPTPMVRNKPRHHLLDILETACITFHTDNGLIHKNGTPEILPDHYYDDYDFDHASQQTIGVGIFTATHEIFFTLGGNLYFSCSSCFPYSSRFLYPIVQTSTTSHETLVDFNSGTLPFEFKLP